MIIKESMEWVDKIDTTQIMSEDFLHTHYSRAILHVTLKYMLGSDSIQILQSAKEFLNSSSMRRKLSTIRSKVRSYYNTHLEYEILIKKLNNEN